jgi:hypothetical protein
MRYRQLAMFGSQSHLVIISWSDDFDEYVCKLYKRLPDGFLQPLAQHDYYTENEEDAYASARQMIRETSKGDEE